MSDYTPRKKRSRATSAAKATLDRRSKALTRFRRSGQKAAWDVVDDALEAWACASALSASGKLTSGRRTLAGGEELLVWAAAVVAPDAVDEEGGLDLRDLSDAELLEAAAFAAHTAGLGFAEVLDYADQHRRGFPERTRRPWLARASTRLDALPPEAHTGASGAADPIAAAEAVERARQALREAEARQANAAPHGRSEHPDLDEGDVC